MPGDMTLSDMRELLATHHVKSLTGERAEIFCLRAHGMEVGALMAHFCKSESGIRHDLQLMQTAVFGALGVESDPYLSGLWLAMHATCCAADVIAATQTVAIFAA